MIDYLDQGQCAAIHHDVHSLRHTQWIFKQSESIMHTNQDPTGLPHFSCEPVQSTHSKAFNETAKAFKTALETACKLEIHQAGRPALLGDQRALLVVHCQRLQQAGREGGQERRIQWINRNDFGIPRD